MDTPKVMSDDSRTASEDTAVSPSVSPDQANNDRWTVKAAYVLGGWSRDVCGDAELAQTVRDGMAASPLGEVTVREYPWVEYATPPLVTYMMAEDRTTRSIAWLRVYAEKVRSGTAMSFDIPNTVAHTIDDIASYFEQLRFDAGEGNQPPRSGAVDPAAPRTVDGSTRV